MELISQREFARRKGVNPNAVTTAIKSGRIKKHKSGKIEWESQSKAWDKNKDPSKARANKKKTRSAAKAIEPPPKEQLAKRSIDRIHEGEDVDFMEAKTAAEIAKAQKADLDVKITIGELIPVEVATKNFERLGTLVKARVEGFPSRLIGDILAAEGNKHTIGQLLEIEAQAILEELSKLEPEWENDR